MSELVGQDAPDFTLRNQDGKKIALSELRGQQGRARLLPARLVGLCAPTSSTSTRTAIADFRKEGASLYGISVDSAFSHKAFQDHLGVEFDLLADFEPKGEVARAVRDVPRQARHERGVGSSSSTPRARSSTGTSPPSPLEIPAASLIVDALTV